MRFNFGKLASAFIRWEAKRLKVKYYLAEFPFLPNSAEPVLITLTARTLWGILALETHWFEQIVENLGVQEIEEVDNSDLIPGLTDTFNVPMFSGYGIAIYSSSHPEPTASSLEGETIDVVPLTNFPD